MNNIDFNSTKLTQALVKCKSVTPIDDGALEIVEKHLLINKDAFCDGSLQKEVMKISSMTGVVHWMLEEIVESMNEVNLLIDEELN